MYPALEGGISVGSIAATIKMVRKGSKLIASCASIALSDGTIRSSRIAASKGNMMADATSVRVAKRLRMALAPTDLLAVEGLSISPMRHRRTKTERGPTRAPCIMNGNTPPILDPEPSL